MEIITGKAKRKIIRLLNPKEKIFDPAPINLTVRKIVNWKKYKKLRERYTLIETEKGYHSLNSLVKYNIG